MSYKPVKAKRHTPPYKIHRYFARRPWNVFRELIKTYTEKGDILVDPFMGGGVSLYEGLRLNRRVIGCDINPLSTFIVNNMVKRDIDLDKLEVAVKGLLNYLNHLYKGYNSVSCKCGHYDEINWFEVAHEVICPSCGEKTPLSKERKEKRARYNCQNPSCDKHETNEGLITPKNAKRVNHVYLERVNECDYCEERNKALLSKNERKKVTEHVRDLEKEIDNIDKRPPNNTKIPLNWDRQYEDYLEEKGITHFSDFFTRRNLLLNYLLRDRINQYKDHPAIYTLLRFIHSASLRRTNIMTFSNKNWNSGRPNAWAKHAFWIPSQFCEVDIRWAFKKSYNKIKKAIEYNKEQNYRLSKASAPNEVLNKNANFYAETGVLQDLNLPSKSIDHVITDPPYGSNVQYLELSHFWYVWNKDLYDINEPNFKKEAIANRKTNREGAKTYVEYENNLKEVYDEIYRILKPDGKLIFTFNNKDLKAWLAVLFAVFEAGFTLKPGEIIFQDGVKEYKHTAHTKAEGSPYGDFIYVFEKQKTEDLRKFEENVIESFGDLKDCIEEEYNQCIDEYINEKGKERNEILQKFFLKIVPKVERFVKYGKFKNEKSIYDKVNKTFFKKIYQSKKE